MKLSSILKFNLAAAAVAGMFSLTSCREEYDGFKLWDNIEKEEPVMKPRMVWIDAASNFIDYANSKENIETDAARIAEMGFTHMIVDVRSTTGDVLFKTDKCDQATALKAWVNGVFGDVVRTATWDYLQAWIDAGHKNGLKVYAGFNTMTGGNRGTGILYRDPSKREWATYHYNGGNPVNVMDLEGVTEKFFNPGNPEVQEYLCGLLTDLASYPDLDGIVLDRGRYNDLRSDFSPLSKKQFEEYVGETMNKFPAGILPAGTDNATLATPYLAYTTKWLEFRAKTIHDFMAKARETVKSVNPNIQFGVYVGAWYGSYYNTGANWASKSFDASKKYSWASRKYKDYGYADLMDHIILGAYARPGAEYGSSEWTMQGFCIQGKNKIGEGPLVIGGPDIDWVETDGYTQEQIEDACTKSVDACINACDGYFLFDLVHMKLHPYKWPAVAKGLQQYIQAWHEANDPKEDVADDETPSTDEAA